MYLNKKYNICSVYVFSKHLRSSSREIKSLDGVMNEFKEIMREAIQTMSGGELAEHLGHEKHERVGNENYRNGHSKKKLQSQYGAFDVAIPRDRKGTFEPKLVKKREVILNGSEDLIISLYAKGMTVTDIQKHLDDLYGYELSRTTISNMTEQLIMKAKEWHKRPLESVYSIVFMDATVIKVKVDGMVRNVAAHCMLGITVEGKKEIIGMWLENNESAQYWLRVLNDMKERGVGDVLIFAVDGLSGFEAAIRAVYPNAEVQRCIVHQMRDSLRHVSYKDRKALVDGLKCVYHANTEDTAKDMLEAFKEVWDAKYPHISKSWERHWSELSTFFRVSAGCTKFDLYYKSYRVVACENKAKDQA